MIKKNGWSPERCIPHGGHQMSLAIAAGLGLGGPTKFFPLVKSRIVSPLAALRAGFDRFLPDDWPGDDESVGGLIRRRMGDQIAERLVDPLIGSINAGDTDHLDAALTAPQLETAARRNRSLILGLREQSKLCLLYTSDAADE